MKYLLLLISVLFISCSEDVKNNIVKFDCNTCAEYETCNEVDEKCDLKTGYCKGDTDCLVQDEVCDLDTHLCKDKEIVVNCTEGETKCAVNDLLTCENNTWNTVNCLTSNKVCKTEGSTSSCVEEVIEEGTIYPIRTGEIAEDSQVNVKGIVTGIKLDNTSKIEGFFIQENGSNYRGIYVYAKNRLENTLIIGDEVNVSGIYKEYNGLSEIVVELATEVVKTDVNSVRENFSLLTNEQLTTQRVEEYESMIVKVKGEFTVGARDEAFNLQISDNNGNSFLLRDDFYSLQLSSGDKLSEIRGVLTFHYQKFKILPRGEYDLIDNSAICSSVSCTLGEICEVTNEVPACVCDEQNGYYDDGNSGCRNPCEFDGVCIEENKHTCIPSTATDFTCVCDSGYEADNEGICTAVPYCDTATYGSAFGLTGNALASELKVIVNRTYHSYGYDDGRIAMFSYIDNDNGTIMCIYTGEYANHPYVDDFSLLHKGCDGCADKPDNNVWNWEHTWPDSMLNSTDAESDLHHLFPTRAYVNSRRSNYPFGNVDGGDKFCDDGINGPGSCIGYDYVSELKSSIFEPADQQKGNTARAMFYMLIKYKNLDDHKNTAQFTALRAWHSADPVDQKERDRNDKVEMFQHNRNPFVDCPQFVEALYQ